MSNMSIFVYHWRGGQPEGDFPLLRVLRLLFMLLPMHPQEAPPTTIPPYTKMGGWFLREILIV